MADHPNGRMAFVYGELHVDGHLLDRLPVPAATVVVLTPVPGLLHAVGKDADPAGRVFQAVGRDLFYWSVPGLASDEVDMGRLYDSLR